MQKAFKYEWPRYPTGPQDHLYALGVISLNFNLYEFSLVLFLEHYFLKDVAQFIFDRLSNEEKAHLIKILTRDDPNIGEEVAYLLRHFAICAENRHNLLHSRLVMPTEDFLAVEKLARGNPEKILEFQLSIGDLHRTADEMHAGFNFVVDLWHFLQLRGRYFADLELEENGMIKTPLDSEHPTLPKRPPEPRKVNPNQPPG